MLFPGFFPVIVVFLLAITKSLNECRQMDVIPKLDFCSKTCLVDFGWFASCKSIWIVSGRFYTKTENIFPEMSPKVAPVYFTVGLIIFLKRIFFGVNLLVIP